MWGGSYFTLPAFSFFRVLLSFPLLSRSVINWTPQPEEPDAYPPVLFHKASLTGKSKGHIFPSFPHFTNGTFPLAYLPFRPTHTDHKPNTTRTCRMPLIHLAELAYSHLHPSILRLLLPPLYKASQDSASSDLTCSHYHHAEDSNRYTTALLTISTPTPFLLYLPHLQEETSATPYSIPCPPNGR